MKALLKQFLVVAGVFASMLVNPSAAVTEATDHIEYHEHLSSAFRDAYERVRASRDTEAVAAQREEQVRKHRA